MASAYRSKSISELLGHFNNFISSSTEDLTVASTSTSNIPARLNFSNSSTQNETKHNTSFEERRRSIELFTVKNVVSKLENKVDQLETSRKRARIDYDAELETFKNEDQKNKEKMENLERQVAKLVENLDHYKNLSAELKKSVDRTKSVLEKQILTIQREKIKSDEKLDEEICTLKNTTISLRGQLEKNDIELQSKSSEIDMLKDQLAIQTKKSETAMNLLQESEESKILLSAAQLEIETLESKLKNQEESAAIYRIYKSQIQQFPQIEAENKKLKDEIKALKEEQSNVLLLEEQMESLRNSLTRAEERSIGYNQLQIENEVLSSRLKQWADISESHVSPADLAKEITQLQSREANLALTCGDLNTQINVLNNEKITLQTKLETWEQAMVEKDKKLQQNSELIRRLQKKLLLLTKERDSYHRVLDSYENEVTINMSAVTAARIQSLENLVKSYQTHLEKLENDLENAQKSVESKQQNVQSHQSSALVEKIRQIEAQNDKLQEQVSKLQEINNKLQEEKDDLQFTLERNTIKGDYDPKKTKVIHMKWNPLSTANSQKRKEIDALRIDNEKLRERVKILEEQGNDDITDLTVQVEKNVKEHPTSQEIENIKEELKASQLKNQRLLEAFSEKSRELREAFYILTGFRIDLVNTRQYKVISMYAETAEDFLLFQMSPKGEMQLLENSFSSRLSSLIENYLQKQHSIPAFLSNLTLDLFSQQTTVVSSFTTKS